MISNLQVYNQGTTQLLTGTLSDETGTPIPTASLTTLTATLIVKATGQVINTRNGQNIKNANGGTYVDGALTLTLVVADNPHQGGPTIEEHLLILAWTYGTGKGGNEEILLRVRNVATL